MTTDTTLVEQIPDLETSGRPKRARQKNLLFLRNSKAITGLAILGFFAVLAIVGPWIAPYDPNQISPDLVQPPSGSHWLGTDHLGRDVLSQLVVGTRSVLVVGFVAGVAATFIGVVVGVTAGFVGGVGDETLSALANVFLVIPQLPLIIIIAGQLPTAGGLTVALVIAATGWAWGARVLRAQTLSLRRRDFIEAARANGERTWRIVLAEILPNLTAIIAAGFVGTVTFAVLSQITLSFIGILPLDTWNWGTVLFWAQNNLALQRGAWWWFVPAGLCIAGLGMALTLINFGIDEFVNPRLRSTGMHARSLRRRKIRPRVGFTPVVHEAQEDRA
ncbi:ABC transporter permease [Paraoerskovia marina]|uniref:Peptide/nickel transport system permease protein n=1 Tax=Paraoerskovia marina TaxID=545619 RepID=A0A1H1VXZ1_9CELL|nr:ABC transporter permease [Paraoerskovia marina]SDS89126.1 peptide/nickel transport system permease protein [Paraoerskovia marina]